MSELKQDFNKTLLPCPFCPKGQARLQRRGHGYYVICKSCGCRTPLFQYQFDSKEKRQEEAIKAWNQRKPMDDIVERLEELRLAEYDDSDEVPMYSDCEEAFYDGESQGRYYAYTRAIKIVKGE